MHFTGVILVTFLIRCKRSLIIFFISINTFDIQTQLCIAHVTVIIIMSHALYLKSTILLSNINYMCFDI